MTDKPLWRERFPIGADVVYYPGRTTAKILGSACPIFSTVIGYTPTKIRIARGRLSDWANVEPGSLRHLRVESE